MNRCLIHCGATLSAWHPLAAAKMIRSSFLLICFIAFALHAEETLPFPQVPPTSPADAEKTFRVQDGFRMELIAAEPLVTDPVAMVYDENGLAYVVEMNDYPYTDKKSHQPWKENVTDKPLGRVRVLEDTDGDGKFDKSWIFADNLSWPSGIACWKGGVFVTATPDIWYLKDIDGDHKADVRRKVFTGFRKFNVQAVMNNPIWGLDHELYCAGSGNGGQVRPGNKPEAKPVALSHNDFKFDPNTEKFEAITGGERFGNTFDDWGNRFLCNIRNPAQHVVLENRYLARNPFLPVKSAIHDAADAGDTIPVYRISPIEPWRELRARRWTSEQKKIPRSELVGGGVFTSTSGITIYRGAAYPKKFYGAAFMGEVANNLVHVQTVAPDGVTFTAHPMFDKVEFVASTDTWFRPVNFVNAPDGTLHVLDMYREVIEHPWSIPDDIHAQLDLESGRDRGRIYRLAPSHFKNPKQPRLGNASTKELVATLENPNSWWRETAHRLIFERQDKEAVAPLRKRLTKSKSSVARLNALWALEGLNALTDDEILRGLNDHDAHIREHAVQLSEPRLKTSRKLLDKVLSLADDPEIRVRFQTALTLGEAKGPARMSALIKIAQRDAADEWMRAAVLSSSLDSSSAMLSMFLFGNTDFASNDGRNEMIQKLSLVVGAKMQSSEVIQLLLRLRDEPRELQHKVILSLGDGMKRAGTNFAGFVELNPTASKMMTELFSDAERTAKNSHATTVERTQAIRLLGFSDYGKAQPILVALLDSREPQEIQSATVKTLSSFASPGVAEILLERWRGLTPVIRGDVTDAMFARKERLNPLLDAIEANKVSAGQIPLPKRTGLLNHADASIRARAKKLFGSSATTSRKEVIEKYKPAFLLAGDKLRGEKIFEANCASCHRFGNAGHDLGPNLATVRGWDSEKILVNTLDPNREVAPNYVAYSIDLKNGETVSGIITAETATSITLNRAGSVQETVLREDVEKISSGGVSLMPEGLESTLTPQQFADLIAFLLEH